MARIMMKKAHNESISEAFEGFMLSAQSRGLTNKTLASYRTHFHSISKRLDIEKPISQLTKKDLEEMIAKMREENLTDTSINSYTRTLMPLQIIRQDITKMHVDAIVNTTNEEMVGYSGVDLAVHEGAGPKLDAECARIAPLGLGTAKITAGYNLPAKYIIHTSGPVWHGGLLGESIILKSCYIESLRLAAQNGLESVAFPLISSGAYGYPKDQVLKFAVQVITEFLDEHELDVYLCVFDKTSYEFSKELFEEINEFIDDGCAEEEYCPDETPFDIDLLSMFSKKKSRASAPPPPMQEMMAPQILCNSAAEKSLQEYMETKEKSFGWKLFELIDESGMTDIECYKKANVDRKTFSKIKNNPDTYKPSKQTAVAFAIALHLSLDETQELLATAGLTLSKSFVFDKIIRYFIQKGNYNVYEINEALFEFDQVLLGC